MTGRLLILSALTVLLAGIATRIGLLNLPAQFDEFYHLLPARSLNDGAGFRILDGEYRRGAGFTRALALHLRLLGQDDLATARLFPMLLGAAVPMVLFLWLNRHAGWAVAALAAVLAILWPAGIFEAQTVRFYSLQVLTFLIGAAAFYNGFQASGRARAAWLALAVPALAVALSAQMSTLIGAAALGLWWALAHALPFLRRHPAGRWVVTLGVPAALLLLFAAYRLGVLHKAWEFYRWVPAHSEKARDDVLFYHRLFLEGYGPLWAAFPVVLFLAIWRARRMGLFCAVIFAVALVTHSFGAFKAARYLSYVMPFYFALTALAIVAVADWVAGQVSARVASARYLPATAAGLVVLVALISGSFMAPALRLATATAPLNREDWSRVATLVGDWRDVPFRMTTRELDTIAYLGDYDLLISRSRLSETPPFTQFARDTRTGRPIISDTATVAQVMLCVPEGLIVADPGWWADVGWQERLAPTLATPGFQFQTRADDQNFLLRWQSPQPPAGACDLPGL
ncbi:hypothetical protein [Actibacterium ureilyticum]|uniref:hypothetical protein n=1 Tax=Actibacterium ureilyticum TaxID=1590614 RepID=UPI001140A534|nr:hypothetical protein [Actibacterium ureilyticum]